MAIMTQTIDTPQTNGPDIEPYSRLGRNDPLLQELWAVKAALNAEADYSIEKLAEQARNSDLEATLVRLKREVAGH